MDDDLAFNVLLNNVEGRSAFKVEKYLVSQIVLKTALEKVTKKDSTQGAVAKQAESETLDDFLRVVRRAVEQDASDIHFRGDRKNPRIEFRVLGTVVNSGIELSYDRLQALLNAQFQTQSESGSNTGSVLTYQSQQRAAFPIDIEVGGKTEALKLRFEITNSQSGFHSAMRILWMSGDKVKKGQTLKSDMLRRGYHDDQAQLLALASLKNGGSIVLSGQTGSGKTNTLYNIMGWICTDNKISISIEDPIEGDLAGVTQIPVVVRDGESVDTAINGIIKSMLRLDPDIALVSELRGRESASGFQQLLQSGHKSLTTVHADSPIGIYERLASDQLGIDRGFLSTPDNLTLCVFQNLVQVVCPECGLPHSAAGISADYMRSLERTVKCDLSLVRFRNPDGCSICRAVSPIPGIAKREVAASMWLPDDDTLLLLRNRQVLEGIREFGSRRSVLHDSDTTGKTAMEVAIKKMIDGRVDPREIESVFAPFELYESQQKHMRKGVAC
ncbi:ATPase, T2SS/T4P/T4SS family [Undibacterium arcticum]|uniref:ATPase, T2SS/T4P/T4SS family n=1 Tax=Undibacterium arcticum TaxID=1762892 RepID=UPI00361FF3E9